MEHLRSQEFPDIPPDQPEGVGLRRFAKDILEVAVISIVLFVSINAIPQVSGIPQVVATSQFTPPLERLNWRLMAE